MHVIPSLATLFTLLLMADQVRAEFAVPDCATLERWSAVLGQPAQGMQRYDPEWQRQAAAAREQLLSDATVTRVFGRPAPQWGDANTTAAREGMYACVQAARTRGDAPVANRLNLAMALIHEQARGGARANPDTARIHTPSCSQVATWARKAAAQPDGTSVEKRQALLYSDAETDALFGLAFSQWQDNDLQFASEALNRCRLELLPRGTTTPPGSEGAQTRLGLEIAQSFIGNKLKSSGVQQRIRR